ncbi:hypothetical protein ACLK1S_20265 [Escherichia coli]
MFGSISGVYTTFHRMAANVNFFLLDSQRSTGSDTQLFFYSRLNAGVTFCNLVFYLTIRVFISTK